MITAKRPVESDEDEGDIGGLIPRVARRLQCAARQSAGRLLLAGAGFGIASAVSGHHVGNAYCLERFAYLVRDAYETNAVSRAVVHPCMLTRVTLSTWPRHLHAWGRSDERLALW